MSILKTIFSLSFRGLKLLFRAAVHMAGQGRSRGFVARSPLAIDGDTIFSNGTKIRVFGIDAPEMDQPGGEDAKRKMAEMVKGRNIRVDPIETDVYGRTVARIWSGSRDIGAAMVAGGYAVARCPAYRPSQARAQNKKLGLWRNGAISDPAAWRRRTT